jgi:hypothetical protein
MPDDPSADQDLAAALAPLRFPSHLFAWVREWRSPVEIRCGGRPPPPDPPFAASLYPFTTLTRLDFEEYPNWRDKRLEPNLSLGPQGWYVGYEDGEFVSRGTFAPGRKLRWEMRLEVLCATHDDTFVEFVVEPNPRIGVHEGPDRLRCLTGALGTTWSGWRPGAAWFEVSTAGPKRFAVQGELALPATASRPALSRGFDVEVETVDYDSRGLDALWQLRWRIDRLANLDAYDGTYQVGTPDGEPLERGVLVRHASLRAT